MKSISPLLLLAVMAAVTLGVPLGLYALLTRRRRRTVSEIKSEASRRGWEFRLRRWLGDPTAFRIDGWTRSGVNWVLKTGVSSAENKGWTVRLGLHLARLGGEMDFAVFPREPDGHSLGNLASRLSPRMQARVAEFSPSAASAAGFLRDALDTPSGLPAFDATNRILTLANRFGQNPIDSALAERIMKWPADAIAPKEVLTWRDPFGVHLHAHLPGTPNWATITHFLAIAEDFCARLPTPVPTSAPNGFWDRLLARLLES